MLIVLPRADDAQVRHLADAGDPFDVVALVLAFTGLRWGERAALRVRDGDLERRRVHVVRRLRHPQEPPAPRARLAGRHPDELASPAGAGAAVLRTRDFRVQVFDSDVGLDGLTPDELRHTATPPRP